MRILIFTLLLTACTSTDKSIQLPTCSTLRQTILDDVSDRMTLEACVIANYQECAPDDTECQLVGQMVCTEAYFRHKAFKLEAFRLQTCWDPSIN